MKILLILAMFGSGIAQAACEVKSVRRLNVSNGVLITFEDECTMWSSAPGWNNLFHVDTLRVVGASEANVSQLVTMATAALVHNKKVGVTYDRHMLSNRQLSGYTAFEIMK